MIRHARSEDSAAYECRAQGAVGPPAVASANVSVLPPVTAAPDDSSEYHIITLIYSCHHIMYYRVVLSEEWEQKSQESIVRILVFFGEGVPQGPTLGHTLCLVFSCKIYYN